MQFVQTLNSYRLDSSGKRFQPTKHPDRHPFRLDKTGPPSIVEEDYLNLEGIQTEIHPFCSHDARK
jgi:hypothetical protein